MPSGTKGQVTAPVSTHVDKELWAEVREFAEKHDRPIARVVRRALREYLDRENDRETA